MSVVQLERVTKCFELHAERARSLQELFLSVWRPRQARRRHDYLWALRDVSLTIGPGEMVALIGDNGSGKSTCLKLMTGILEPTSGSVAVHGRTASLLELGAGFHPELTGRENIALYGSVLGLGRREMAARFDDIVAFAELQRFIDVAVKFYSSGMYVRLAFATAVSVNPELLLVDEVLAVGDQSFQTKCLERIAEMKQAGVTIVLVSHSLDTVLSMCDRAIWLDEGRLQRDGPTRQVIQEYLASVYGAHEAEEWLQQRQPCAPEPDQAVDNEQITPGSEHAEPAQAEHREGVASRRWGTHRAEITQVTLLDQDGQATAALRAGDRCSIAIAYLAHERLEHPGFGVAFFDSHGNHLVGANTVMAGCDVPVISGSGTVRYAIRALPLPPGNYYLSAALHNADETEAYDYHHLGYGFRVVAGQTAPHVGVLHMPATWAVETGDQEATT
jgi:ABC-type polysaccharide/polyol phosphate transport system ATPase subunit